MPRICMWLATVWYTGLVSVAQTSAIERVVRQLGNCLTPDSARRVADIRAEESLQERLDLLAEKNAEGQITPDEREELEGYVRAADFLSILQAEARRILRESPDG